METAFFPQHVGYIQDKSKTHHRRKNLEVINHREKGQKNDIIIDPMQVSERKKNVQSNS